MSLYHKNTSLIVFQVIIQIAKDLDWPVVTLIHSMDDYGIAGADRIEHYAKVYGICIYRRFAINLRMDKSGIVSNVRSRDHPNGIIYFGYRQECKLVLILMNYLVMDIH